MKLSRNNEPTLQQALSKAGLSWTDPSHASMRIGRHVAQLRLEPGNCLHVYLEVLRPSSARTLLRRNAVLPGNTRFAAAAGRRGLVADLRAATGKGRSPSSCVAELAMLVPVLANARRGAGKPLPEPEPLDRDYVAEVIAQVERGDHNRAAVETVALDEGWEFRPRVAGVVVPVRAFEDEGMLQLGRSIVADLPNGHCGKAVADHALRTNARLRHARLQQRAGKLEATTNCHRPDADELARAIRSVATAAQHAAPVVAALIAHPDVARSYVHSFCPTQQSPISAKGIPA